MKDKLIKLIRKLINEAHHHVVEKKPTEKYESEAKAYGVLDLDRNLFYILRRDSPLKSYKTFSSFNTALKSIPNDRIERIEYKVNLGGEDVILSIEDYENLLDSLKKLYYDVVSVAKDLNIRVNKIDEFELSLNKKGKDKSYLSFDPKKEIKLINTMIETIKKNQEKKSASANSVKPFRTKLNEIGKQLYPIWYSSLVGDTGIEKKDKDLQTDTISKSFRDSPEMKKQYSYPYFDPRGFTKK